MNKKYLITFLPIMVALNGCTTPSKESACANMAGQYQSIDSPLALKDKMKTTVYLKRISNTSNGFYGVMDVVKFQAALQPMVRENPQCEVIFDRVHIVYTPDSSRYGCNYAMIDNADKSRFFCLKKISNKTPSRFDVVFDEIRKEPFFNNMSEVNSVIEWNHEL
ncbi:hypothetical protein HX773_14945 [Pantoea sp. B9002]|uniref:hypothetical protein n=1 Tax=Pantoea sp. B9002 TaxID=2726979 RepID=UPI0015A088D2|nr:hypothetical protein [Pantoea sp. B9002]NWA62193.1 hypothetical protein [Pantoea sp. B9002]